jgi:transposase-like protein
MAECSVCIHRERRAIDDAIAGGRSLRGLSREHGMSPMSLSRHRDNHLAARVAAAAVTRATDDAKQAGRIVDRLARLADAAERAAFAAIAAGAGHAPSSIREARETLLRVGDLTGELRDDGPIGRAKSLLEQLVEGLDEP